MATASPPGWVERATSHLCSASRGEEQRHRAVIGLSHICHWYEEGTSDFMGAWLASRRHSRKRTSSNGSSSPTSAPAWSRCGRVSHFHSSWSDPRRRLACADYLSLLLFALVNPVVATLRGVCAATQLQRVQEEVSSHSASLGSLSEAQHLLEPALLEPLIESLSAQIYGSLPADPRAAWQEWFARDSSLFAALPRMAWAQYGGGARARPTAPCACMCRFICGMTNRRARR